MSEESSSLKSSLVKRCGSMLPPPITISAQFPFKLHQILDDAEQYGFAHTIAWMDDGESFKVYDKDRLEQEIMPRYFTSGKFKSFQRSLNLWGFACGKNEGSVLPSCSSRRCHPLFQRGRPYLCQGMRRTRVKKPGTRGHKINVKKEAECPSLHEEERKATKTPDGLEKNEDCVVRRASQGKKEDVSSPRQDVSCNIPYLIPSIAFQALLAPPVLSPCLPSTAQSIAALRGLTMVSPAWDLSLKSLTQARDDMFLEHFLSSRIRALKVKQAMQNPNFHSSFVCP